jgi:hypothetical protein
MDGLSRALLTIVDAAEKIAIDKPEGDDIAFLDGLLCTVGLPRSRVSGNVFERTSGRAALRVEAGQLWNGRKWIRQIVPYGPIPRLMLAWICTQAIRYESREIWIGNSASEFLRLIGKPASGGQANRGAHVALRSQATALSACRLQLGWSTGKRVSTANLQPIVQFEAWAGGDERQRSLWSPTLTLSEEFYARLAQHSAPLDWRALCALGGSALALDIYSWLAHRLHRLRTPGYLPWCALRDQFGQEYIGANGAKNFKRAFSGSLVRALAVYPQADVSVVHGGLRLKPSHPPVVKTLSRSGDKPVGRVTYPRDISTPCTATLPPPNRGADCDIATPLKPIAFTDSKTNSSDHESGDNYALVPTPQSERQRKSAATARTLA